ncbi:hypothetical protein ABW19_dt0208032 [Dactylella cylindrospora]|nr:hypothetical protein ABW19_dt0208032 [Dactylella cylindrospora]
MNLDNMEDFSGYYWLTDRIIVLDQGRVAEFDTPAALLAKGTSSPFYGLVKEAGLLEEASSAATGAGVFRQDGEVDSKKDGEQE